MFFYESDLIHVLNFAGTNFKGKLEHPVQNQANIEA